MSTARTDRSGAVGTPGSAEEGWRAVLDRLEHDVLSTERSLREGQEPQLDPWSPPQVPGPVPPSLRARAADLLNRQIQARDQVVTRLAGNRNQQALVDQVGRATATHHRPAYLDLAL